MAKGKTSSDETTPASDALKQALAESPEVTAADAAEDPELEDKIFGKSEAPPPADPIREVPAQTLETAGAKVVASDPDFSIFESADGSLMGAVSKEFIEGGRIRRSSKADLDDPRRIQLDLTKRMPPTFYDSGYEDQAELLRKTKAVLGEKLFNAVAALAAGSNISVHRFLQQSLYPAMQSGDFDCIDADEPRNAPVDENLDHPATSYLRAVLNDDVFSRLLDKARERKVSNLDGFRSGLQGCLDKGALAR